MECIIAILALIFLGIIIGLFINVFWLGFALVFYFVPTIIAAYRKHPQTLWIFLINLFFGWTFVGWLIPALWACDFDKLIKDFIEFEKAKHAKDSVIEGEVVEENKNSNEQKEDNN